MSEEATRNAERGTRNAERETRNAERGTRNVKRGTRNAERETRNAERETRNAERETRNAKRETRNAERETRNVKRGTRNAKRETPSVKRETRNGSPRQDMQVSSRASGASRGTTQAMRACDSDGGRRCVWGLSTRSLHSRGRAGSLQDSRSAFRVPGSAFTTTARRRGRRHS
jgi:hypothetical protein